jgi:hypothetical protein
MWTPQRFWRGHWHTSPACRGLNEALVPCFIELHGVFCKNINLPAKRNWSPKKPAFGPKPDATTPDWRSPLVTVRLKRPSCRLRHNNPAQTQTGLYLAAHPGSRHNGDFFDIYEHIGG